jgi:hypothetical protein
LLDSYLWFLHLDSALRDDINENLEELKQKKDKQEQLYQEVINPIVHQPT